MNEKNSLSEAFESRVLDSISEHVIYYNKDFEIKWANRAAADSVDLSPLELIGKKCYSIWQNRTSPCEQCPVLDALKTGKSNSVEMITPDGRVWLIKGNPVYDKNEKIIGAVEITREITDLKEVEQKLIASQENYRNLIERSNDAIFLVNLKNEILFANQACYDIFGYAPEEFLTIQGLVRRILHPKYEQQFEDFWKNYEITKFFPENTTEWAWIKKDGELVYTENNFFNILDEKKLVIGFGTVARNITLRKKADLLLKESEEKYRNILENMMEGYYETDLIGNLVYVNIEYCKIMGYSKEEVIGKNYRLLYDTNSSEILFNMFNQVFKTGIPLPPTGVVKVITKKKKLIYFEGSVDLLYDSKGNKVGFYGLVRDIMKRKIAEQKLKKSEEKFREAFNRANFYKDLFAHDMSNILQNIYSAFQLSLIQLKKGEQLKDIYENIDIIINQVNRGAKLISNVRKLSELEHGELHLQSIEALNILNKCIKFVVNTFQNQEINIKIDSQNKKFIVKVNNLLEDVFENILINAVKHNQNSHVDVMIRVSKVQKEGLDFVKFEFKDNGIGIPDANKELIFQRAFNTEKTVSGMGIGLSLVKKILDIYNGQIWVEDKVQGDYSKGSNFIVLIPKVNT